MLAKGTPGGSFHFKYYAMNNADPTITHLYKYLTKWANPCTWQISLVALYTDYSGLICDDVMTCKWFPRYLESTVHEGPVRRRFNVLFDDISNKLLSKQMLCRWFKTPWRSCDVIIMFYQYLVVITSNITFAKLISEKYFYGISLHTLQSDCVHVYTVPFLFIFKHLQEIGHVD